MDTDILNPSIIIIILTSLNFYIKVLQSLILNQSTSTQQQQTITWS